MHRRILTIAGAAAFAALINSAPAHASLFCEVVKTRDNFVALRATPDAGAKLLARMKAGDEVMLAGEKRRGWERVQYWPKGDRIENGEKAVSIHGWVNAKLIETCG